MTKPKRHINKSHQHNVYANLSHHKRKRRTRKDAAARRRAEYLASLPKHPVQRFFFRLHPKRVAGYWFSKRGAKMFLKLAGVGILLVFLMIGSLFAYFRKDLEKIHLTDLASRVQTTVTTYYDRNGVVLWQDKGSGNYKLAIKQEDMGTYIRQATVAIEDRSFYQHHGVSVTGLVRAAVNNATGGEVQGGSTLTQQLVKQVFFSDDAGKRGLNGIPRKIKEVILAIEVERSYDKEDIITLYLNESPYGGRRNGVESAARTYFGTTTKKLTLAQAALIAAIPQNPSSYNPYNVAGHEALVSRQHRVLNNMVDLKMITREEADAAIKVPILDQVKPETDQYKNMKAQHFVLYVKEQLEKELGVKTVGEGGLEVHTTLDYRIQQRLEKAMNDMFKTSKPGWAGFNNGAGTVIDSKTGQIIAMLGSRDFNYPGYGQSNAAKSYLQPASTIKPLVYASLIDGQRKGFSFGSGSILSDERLSGTLATAYGSPLKNFDSKFRGSIPMRKALAESRNIPAVKAMYINGVQQTIDKIREAGDVNYCTRGVERQVGLSSAIGSCSTDQLNHTNAIATLARNGLYIPPSDILSVKNSSGNTLRQWEKVQGKRVFDAQTTYIISDILSDPAARAATYYPYLPGLVTPGVKTAVKTGTSDFNKRPKDLWMMSYSPALTMGVWLGNNDNRPLLTGSSSIPGPIIADVMAYAHEIYKKEGKYTTNEWFTRPSGIKVIRGELYPSWFNEKNLQNKKKLVFDKVSKKLATECTPELAKEAVELITYKDPVTNKDVFYTEGDYNPEEKDDIHKCTDKKPTIDSISVNGGDIRVSVSRGDKKLKTIEIRVNGKLVKSMGASGSGTYSTAFTFEPGKDYAVTATVIDEVYYSDDGSFSHSEPAGNGNGGGNNNGND